MAAISSALSSLSRPFPTTSTVTDPTSMSSPLTTTTSTLPPSSVSSSLTSSTLSPSLTTATFTLTSTPGATRTLAPLEPADGKLLLGAWLDTSNTPDGGDTTTSFDQRLGFRANAFEFAQNIPVTLAPSPPYPNNTYLYANMTDLAEPSDAIVFLTVYPNQGLGVVKQSDFDNLARQLATIKAQTGRSVMLRYGPEMNGEWMAYGKQPDAFVASWKQMADTVRKGAPGTALVWGPNMGNSEADYLPYWPGSDYVDWVGLSVYWKGYKADYPWMVNKVAPPDYAASLINGTGGEGGQWPFYAYFCQMLGKPFVFTETGAAFHEGYYVQNSANPVWTPIDPGVGREQTVMSYYNGFLFSDQFLTQFPLVKMINLFEFVKNETDGGFVIHRDFRATNGKQTGLSSFANGVAALKASGRLVEANYVSVKPSATVSVSNGVTVTAGVSSSKSSSGKTFAASWKSVWGTFAVGAALCLASAAALVM